MSPPTRVTERARERVAREFDTRGSGVCMAEVIEHLKRHNPELLDMALKCAGDPGESRQGPSDPGNRLDGGATAERGSRAQCSHSPTARRRP
jgi:hypothetical protein